MNNNYFLDKNDTITAISTPNGKGAISIIRISGKKSINIIKKIFIKNYKINKKKKLKNIKYNKTILGIIFYKKKIIDQVIIIIYKKPNSYTGENLVEINCHGSIFIQKKIILLIIKKGARLAKNGEFTFRSYLNKKINLIQAESINDLIKSENKIYHNLAINNLIYGNITYIILKIQKKILNIIYYLELKLDFSEENIDINKKKIKKNIFYIEKKLKNLIKSFNLNTLIKKGFYISIIGPVNSGKSTLMNCLIKKNKSIITNIPGTTRDIVEDNIIINDFNFHLYDTAGIRKTNCYIEKLGIKKTFKIIKKSNIIFYVFNIKKLINNYNKFIKKIKKLKKYFLKKYILLIANKIDTINYKKIKINNKILNYKIIFISAKNKKGIKKIINFLKKKIPNKIIKNNDLINNIRHLNELKNSLKYFKKFKKNYIKKISFEYLLIDLKLSLEHLYNINGNGKKINNNDILNDIFSKFCIGK